jgi:hypothetical protein
MSDIDMMDIYYPTTSDDENIPSVLSEPTDLFETSWCRNGHDLRIDPGATVVFIATYPESNPPRIIRNAHSHPLMDKGVVYAINHVEKTVQIGPLGKPIPWDLQIGPLGNPIPWDLVVGRLDSKHLSMPVALYGTNEVQDDAGAGSKVWCTNSFQRRTVDFASLSRYDVRKTYIKNVIGIEVKEETLASVALQALEDSILASAAKNKTSFFVAADKMIV